MQNANEMTRMKFILLGLFNHTGTHLFHFSMVFLIFITSLMGNALMIVLIHTDTRLHMPMYFLLSQLSFMDMMLVLIIVPKMASNYLMGTGSISPTGCGAQIFLFLTLGGGECFLLAAMSYDRYVAICQPTALFHSNESETMLAHDSRFLGFRRGDGLLQAGANLSYPYCHSPKINHFFCEAPSLVCVACADTTNFGFFMCVCCILMLLIPLSVILVSCGHILSAVLAMQSTKARKKAFTTFSSHLAIVGLFYDTLMFIYMRAKSNHSVDHDKVVSAFYTILTPVLNPLIYSVRNKEVKGTFRKWLEKHFM